MTASRVAARKTIAICTVIYALDGLIHTILGPLAPEIARTLSLGNAQLGPIFSSNLIGQCIGLVLFPAIATRFGHRLTVTLAVVGFALGQAASALADSGAQLFAIRLATGIFLGGCLPSCLAIVTEQAPEGRRGLSILSLFTGYGLGAALAGAVAAGFAEFGGWRTAMVAIGALSLATAVGAWLWLLEPDPLQPASSAQGQAAGTLAAVELVRSEYMVGTLMLWLLFILLLTISYCLNSWLPIMLVDAGFSESFAALSVTTFGFGGAIAALGVGILIDRFGAMTILLAFLTMAAALLFATGQAMEDASPTLLTLLLAATGFFSLGAYGGVNVVLAGFYPGPLRATGIGWAKSVGRLGTVIAPITIGFALSAGMTGSSVMSLFAVPAVLAGLALVVISFTATWRAHSTG
ncbi:MFS transporter [Altererythrobacter salegens]|uniref:MFS transporter n=1 Tax=Croceibacterium salegens TaxID=1737568 RepID=A0A6I4SVJ5_9SPHN|nr:MFS transporter [Croceibacterium salegens]MXO59971.1 MFS transporter [Croceibacterium salegens]